MTVTTIRPNGTAIASGMTSTPVVAPTSMHTLLNSTTDDSSYVFANHNNGRLLLNLGTFTLAANQRIRAARSRLRLFRDSADSVREFVDTYLTYDQDGTSTPLYTNGTLYPTVVEYSSGWFTAGPNGRAWTQAVLNGLRLQLIWKTSKNGRYVRISETYVDVDVNSRPVLSGFTIDGVATTTAPVGNWTYDDDDNDPQARYKLKIFRSGQAGVGGVDPFVQDADWDSGEVTSSDTTAQVGNLQNGTSYVAYLWAGQDWDGPEGPTWWSAPVTYSFTISVIGPVAPTLTVAADNAPPAFWTRTEVTDTNNLLEYGVANPDDSVEALSPAPWSTVTNAAVNSYSTTQSYLAPSSVRLTASAAGDMTARNPDSSYMIPVRPGESLTFAFRARPNSTARQVRAEIEWRTSAVASTGTPAQGTAVTETATSWAANPFVSTTVPAGAFYAIPRVRVVSAASGEIHDVDAFIVLRKSSASAPAWSPGVGASGATIRLQRWEPAPYDILGLARNLVSRNVASAGQALGTLDGFDTASTDDALEVVALNRAFPDAYGTSDTCLRFRPYTGTLAGFFASTDEFVPLVSNNWTPALPGASHTSWVWAWTASGTYTTAPVLTWVDSADATISSSVGATVTLTTTPQLVQLTATAPALSAGVTLSWRNVGTVSTGIETFWYGFGLAYGSSSYPGSIGVLQPRLFTDIDVTSGRAGDVTRFTDREVAGGRMVFYRARTEIGTLVSDWSPVVGVYLDLPARTILRSVNDPRLVMVAKREPEITESQLETASLFMPLGATRPVKIRDSLAGQDSQMVINYESEGELHRIRELVADDRELLIQWHNGGQTYILVTGRDTGRLRSDWGRYSMTYVESGR